MSTEKMYREVVRKLFNPKSIILRPDQPRIHKSNRNAAPSIYQHTVPMAGKQISEGFNGDRRSNRRFYPNYHQYKLPVTLFAEEGLHGQQPAKDERMKTVNMRLRGKELKDIEKAGGLEAKLASTAGNRFSADGRLLRAALFRQLHRIRQASMEGLHSIPRQPRRKHIDATERKQRIGSPVEKAIPQIAGPEGGETRPGS